MDNYTQRRFKTHGVSRKLDGLAPDHLAMRTSRTLFPGKVVQPEDSPRLLVSGQHNRKTGARVEVGKWKGAPIFNLTLEERATCPSSCHHWATCYGNGMPHARRHAHGAIFEELLERELEAKNEQHEMFVVRLHILGDFYGANYVHLWEDWLRRYPAIRVFGYTAHDPESYIGAKIKRLRDAKWDRFAVRFSSLHPKAFTREAVSTDSDFAHLNAVACPAQKHDHYFCGVCGICWGADKNVMFETHGRVGLKKEYPLLEYGGVLPSR